MYAADPSDPKRGPTVFVVLSLLHDGSAEVRLLRGAPAMPDAGALPSSDGAPMFGLFPLKQQTGSCGF
jgi:hypothetical protein